MKQHQMNTKMENGFVGNQLDYIQQYELATYRILPHFNNEQFLFRNKKKID